jgi:hypothetical protein
MGQGPPLGVFRRPQWDGAITTVLPHRKGVGGIKLHVNGGLIVSGRNVSWKPWGGGDGAILLETDPSLGNRGFNGHGRRGARLCRLAVLQASRGARRGAKTGLPSHDRRQTASS